jgi:hypothetical protein
MRRDKRGPILSHFSSSQTKSSPFLPFDSGFSPENLNISFGVTVRIRDIGWVSECSLCQKIFGSLALLGMDSHCQQLHRVVLSRADSITGWKKITLNNSWSREFRSEIVSFSSMSGLTQKSMNSPAIWQWSWRSRNCCCSDIGNATNSKRASACSRNSHGRESVTSPNTLPTISL